MKRKNKIRKVSVLEIQKLPAEKVIELFDQFNHRRIEFVSIYHDRWAQIGLESPVLSRFIERNQSERKSAINRIIIKLSRRWEHENEKELSEEAQRLGKKDISSIAPPGFHSAKML